MARAIVLVKRTTKIGDEIEVDSCLEENHVLENTVTDHPVEEGYNITDHVRPNPDRVTLRCFVSNTPLSTDQTKTAVREGSVDFETTAPETIVGRGDDTYKKLAKLRAEGTLIEVVTTLRTYGLLATEGMAIESISIPRTRQNFDGLEFALSLKQVRIVQNRSSRQTKAKDKRRRPKKKEGTKPTQPPAKKGSLLSKIDDSSGNAISNSINGMFSGGN